MEAYVSSGAEIPTFLTEMEGRLRNTFAYPEDQSQELLAEKLTYDAVEKDVAHVNIFFGQNHCMEYERDLKRTLPEILVDMASWFGVFLGVSILSIVEIVYWVLLGKQ